MKLSTKAPTESNFYYEAISALAFSFYQIVKYFLKGNFDSKQLLFLDILVIVGLGLFLYKKVVSKSKDKGYKTYYLVRIISCAIALSVILWFMTATNVRI